MMRRARRQGGFGGGCDFGLSHHRANELAARAIALKRRDREDVSALANPRRMLLHQPMADQDVERPRVEALRQLSPKLTLEGSLERVHRVAVDVLHLGGAQAH